MSDLLGLEKKAIEEIEFRIRQDCAKKACAWLESINDYDKNGPFARLRARQCAELTRAIMGGGEMKTIDELSRAVSALKDATEQRDKLLQALDSIIDDASDSANEYSDRWGNYRKEIQDENFARVARAREVLEQCKESAKQ